MQFMIPDPTKFRISDCGMYLIEKISLPNESPVYAVWEYTRVSYGNATMEDAVAAIKNREADRLSRESEYWASREPDARLVGPPSSLRTNPTSSESS